MKRPLYLLSAALCLSALAPLSAAPDNFLIVPGHSIGKTKLGLNGSRALTTAPTVGDASMGGNVDEVWQSKNGHTLYIHTHRNDMNDPPKPGYTVTEIRVTSPKFHTTDGLAPGSTLAAIQHRYPKGTLSTVSGDFYTVGTQGIAFEFAAAPKPGTPSLAISITAPGADVGMETAAQVKSLLENDSMPVSTHGK